MKGRVVIVVLFCFSIISLAHAADEAAFQPGKIVSIQKRTEAASPHNPDEIRPNVATYDVVIETGGRKYTCVYQTLEDLDPSWAKGKEGQVRVAGKAMYIKRANGKADKLSIVKSE